MTTWTPDPSFYPSPRMAAKAPVETLAYVAAFDPDRKTPDAIAVVDVDPASQTYSEIVGQVEMPNTGDELHHFGWNACSSCLCPNAPHPHVERRYLVVPGLRSSRLHIIDTKPDPKNPRIVRVIEPEEIAEKAGRHRRQAARQVDPALRDQGAEALQRRFVLGRECGRGGRVHCAGVGQLRDPERPRVPHPERGRRGEPGYRHRGGYSVLWYAAQWNADCRESRTRYGR